MRKTLLIIDDEKDMGAMLKQYFELKDYDVILATVGKSGIERAGRQPDLILLDINMPKTDGLSLCRSIRNHVVCPILFLTARITEQDKINGLRIGGDDYITKPFSLMELTARVEAHLRRDSRSHTEPDIVSSKGLLINLSERTVFFNGQEAGLSKREFDIVEFLIANANQVFDKERIYEAVWGYDALGDSNVVKEHIRKIRAKLYKIAGTEYIETVWGIGYKWIK